MVVSDKLSFLFFFLKRNYFKLNNVTNYEVMIDYYYVCYMYCIAM